ncbi:hypothetical protein E0Z10_g2600 [Xylaria hypoxylon]|uniref:High-temperature-induced dauer-formation protein n=1 Tax=Xylaria hypoxylon TaxID=37992 RepID=A0A4Z0YQM0_9PEZI|nr:hypothetical protein E0Z10_g2600 [Xylaria hypoxylon]
MGASDSKLVFKKGIFRLSEERHIPADDPYWTSFWELPESSEDVFSLFSPADIRRTRDRAIENLETLILAVTSRLFILRHHPSFPDTEFAPERDALNCIRILTRILPYLYEADNLQTWEDKFFWGTRRKRTRRSAIANEVLFDEAQDGQEVETPADEFEDAKPLAEELIDTLVDLLFYSDLTVPKQPQGTSKVTYAIWQSGVGCNTAVPTTKEYESNRCEILRLLLTLASQSMYMSPNLLPTKGTKTLTYICTCSDKQVVLSVLCSLLNTTLKYNPASWRVPINTLVFKDPKEVLVTYTLQSLLVILLYPIPESPSGSTLKNYYRHFLGRLHRPQDFQFILDGMTRILNQPIQANTSYIPGTQATARFSPEIIMLFWEVTQCNKRFRSYMIDTQRAHDFVILILFYATEYKLDASKQGVVRMCAFLLQTLSVEKNFGVNLNKHFEHQYEKNPNFIYLVLKNRKRFEALRTFTLETGQEELERRNRQRKENGQSTDPFDISSRRSSVESLRSPNIVVPKVPSLSDVPEEDATFAIGDDEDDSDGDERPTPAQSSSSENHSRASSVAGVEDAVPTQLKGMSEKARGKMPAGVPTFSRQNSTTSLGSYSVAGQSTSGAFEPSADWIESWLPELPLHTILTVIQQLTVLIDRQGLNADSPSAATLTAIREADLVAIESSLARVQSFEWSPLALGWYESLIWSFVFASEVQVAKGTAGIWNGTGIKLFRVQETAPAGPTLTSPRGAVDAVGSNIVSRIGSINLRGAAPAGPASPGLPSQRHPPA